MQMYAQTIVYGLFSARCMCPNNASFSIDKVVECIPSTNPLLKMLMKELLDNSAVKFDELNVSELIDVLKDTDMTSILEDFNRQTGYGREDPLILFYEKFLDLFEQERKKGAECIIPQQLLLNLLLSPFQNYYNINSIIKMDLQIAECLF